MGNFKLKHALKILVCSLVFAGFSGSAVADSTPNVSNDNRVLVFGKFRLVKNEDETRFGPGFFGNTAALTLLRTDDQEEMTIRVGKDGQFARKLSPGNYLLVGIEFKHQGERIETETNYMIRVSKNAEANYLGTITLEAEFQRGYAGVSGKIDRFTVADRCSSECPSLLADLGLSGLSTSTSLPIWQAHTAESR